MKVKFTARNAHIDAISQVWDTIMSSRNFTVVKSKEMRFRRDDGIVPECVFEIETDASDALRLALRKTVKAAGIVKFEIK